MKMKYTGNGNFLPGVPARDLTDAEVDKHGVDKLLSTGLYEIIREVKEVKPKRVRKPIVNKAMIFDEVSEE